MNFITPIFIAFLATVFLLFILVPARFRKPLLLIVSYIFYGTWSIPFLGLILLTTNIDYWMSRVIATTEKLAVKKTALTFGLLVNLAVLFYFKYCNFFLANFHSIFRFIGLDAVLPKAIDIILPLGISFFTFEAISYMVDVYRGQKPAPNWLDYNFYIMYFPHLISGPIIRFKELYSQYGQKDIQLPTLARLAQGFELILLGFIFKICIADPSSALVDPVFADPAHQRVLATYVGVLAFTVQIYFDFMGYTHIARGISLLFNLELPLNFNHPYHATSISNFWQRWHISLSTWIRDYLYFPLGGSKGSLFKTIFNLLITMTICGFWHGSGWNYILWGVFHGVLLGLYHLYKHIRTAIQKPWMNTLLQHSLYQTAGIAATFIAVAFGWVLFRATNLSTGWIIWDRLLRFNALIKDIRHVFKAHDFTLLIQVIFLLLCCFLGPAIIRLLERMYRPVPFWLKVQFASFLLILYLLSFSEDYKPFIYFQF